MNPSVKEWIDLASVDLTMQRNSIKKLLPSSISSFVTILFMIN
jgi:hypothetical protein